ncbi:MAG: hypothetical protein QF860_11935, partial [Planctomycetota bacterium]|nr:hypothetical protein [Planctomycetota bacterium]
SLRVFHTDVDVRFSGDLVTVGNRIYAVAESGDGSTYGVATLEPRRPARLELVDFLPIEGIEGRYGRLAWLDDGYLVLGAEREGLVLLELDPDGSLQPRDRLGLPGVAWRFDLSGELMVSAELEYGLRWVRGPLDSGRREFGSSPEDEWDGVAIIPGTEWIAGQRSRKTVEVFRLEDEPVSVSSDSLGWDGSINHIEAIPGYVAVTGSIQYQLLTVGQEGHLSSVEHVHGVPAINIGLSLWSDTLAIVSQGSLRMELRTYVPGDSVTMQRANWAPAVGTPFDVDVLGREAAFATGNGVEIYDLSDPDSPRLDGRWHVAYQLVKDVALSAEHVVAATWDSLYVLDRAGAEIRRVAAAPIPTDPVDVQLARDDQGRPHIVCGFFHSGYLVFALREGQVELLPAPPPELWGFEDRRAGSPVVAPVHPGTTGLHQ